MSDLNLGSSSGSLVGGFGRTSLPGWRTPEAFRGKVRLFLRDQMENNRLLTSQETSDVMLDMHIELAIEDYNTTAPTTNYVLRNFPSLSLLLNGTIIQALRSAGIGQSRNRLNYNNGGVTVAVSDKSGDYQSWIASLMNEYERKKRDLKISINVSQAFGSVSSEYAFSNLVFF